MTPKQNKPIEPVKTSEGKGFEEWWKAFYAMPTDRHPPHVHARAERDHEIAESAWNARCSRESALVAALKKAEEALEKLNGFGRSDMSHNELCAYVNETCDEALSAITPLLKEKENTYGE